MNNMTQRGHANFCTIFLDFPAHPPLPPSRTQLLERNKGTEFSNKEFFRDLKKLAKNKGFFLHSIAYGLNIAAFSAISTLLNQFVLHYFPVSFQVLSMRKIRKIYFRVAKKTLA